MAGNFDSTIREVMNSTQSKKPKMKEQDNPREMAQDKARGIKSGSPQDLRLDAQQTSRSVPRAAPRADSPAELAQDKARGIAPNSPQDMRMDAMMRGGAPPDAHHVAAATSIAHAILGNRGLTG